MVFPYLELLRKDTSHQKFTSFSKQILTSSLRQFLNFHLNLPRGISSRPAASTNHQQRLQSLRRMTTEKTKLPWKQKAGRVSSMEALAWGNKSSSSLYSMSTMRTGQALRESLIAVLSIPIYEASTHLWAIKHHRDSSGLHKTIELLNQT